LQEYLNNRGFDKQAWEEWGLEPRENEVYINYFDTEGNKLYARRNRPGKTPKYDYLVAGNHIVLYGLNKLKYVKDTLLLIEGEYNCISAWYMGFCSLGVAGQTMTLKEHHLKPIPETVKKIIVLYDDPKFAEKRASEILKFFDYDKEVYIAKYPDNKDANDYYKEGLTVDFKGIIQTADRFLSDQLISPGIKVKIPANDFVEQYKDYAMQISDAPARYQELMALTILSTILGRQAYLKYGVYNLYPNLFVVLIGKSTIMRKTACLNMAKHIISKFNKEYILPSDFTPEGLFNALTEKPRGFITWGEFGGFLINASAKTYQAGIKEFLTEAYDCPNELHKRLSSKEFTIENICLNIATASTLHWFVDRITEADTMGGFLGRFVFIPCKTEDKNGWYYIPQQEPLSITNKILKDLKQISELAGKFEISDEAKVILIKWLRRHENELESLDDSKGIIGFYARLADYLLKFAMLYEVSGNKSLTITEGSLMRAIKLVNWLKQSLNDLMSDHISFTKEARDMQKILTAIREHNEPIPRSLLLRNSNMTSKQLNEILDTLLQSKRIRQFTVGEGKKSTVHYTLD